MIKHSLNSLPVEITLFINSIHHFFKNSPQRKAKLKNIQIENGWPTLSLKPYIKTRWLSLGDSLKRLILIWESLTALMSSINGSSQGLRNIEDSGSSESDDAKFGDEVTSGKKELQRNGAIVERCFFEA